MKCGPRFVFFGGKGGVGKTTCASAFALAASAVSARRRDRRRILVVSTDPAHSLGDAFGVRLRARVEAIAAPLDALELDAPRAFARWIAAHHAAAAEALEHGTWLDRADIDTLLDLPIPGVDELAALIEIDRIAASKRYDLVVVDTAPTGHTLRLLAAPDAVRAVAAVLDAMQEEHRLVRDQLARVGRVEAADRFIEEIAEHAGGIAARLRDAGRTEFRWVTLPEPMSLAESEDAIAALERAGVAVGQVIVNRVLPDGTPCPICDRRRADETKTIARIRRTVGKRRPITLIPALVGEPRGVRALASFARSMARRSRVIAHGASRLGPSHALSISHEPSAVRHEPASLPVVRDATLIFVGGKGGVGKTTVAATIALSLARTDRRRRILLLSTDPAHSLADVFTPTDRGSRRARLRPGVALGDAPANIPGGPDNLFVRELDASAALAARRTELDEALDEIASAVGADATGSGTPDLVDLAPPGIDELFGLLSVFEARAAYDTIVVDTAPTGHALRLLELPETARAWVQVLMRVLLKYRTLVRPGRLATELIDVSKSIREFQATLRDRAATRFLVVTRAAELPRRETERLLSHLKRLRLDVPAIVVNALTLAPGACPRCRRTRAAERRELAALRRAAGRRGIIRTPLAAPSPRGVRALELWARSWLA